MLLIDIGIRGGETEGEKKSKKENNYIEHIIMRGQMCI